jgi:uncharacterized protein
MKFNILDFLLPRETKFYEFFKEQVDVLIEGCILFRNLVSNIKKMSEDEIKIEVTRIKECEVRGDAVESKIIRELNETFITPFDREDIHMIAMNIDQAMDTLTSLTNKIEIYGIHKLPKEVHNFSELIVEIAEMLKKLMTELESKKNIETILKSMHTLENNADYLFYLTVGELFKKETNPIEVIKLKEVYEYLENVVDDIDHVGKIVRRVIIKQG